MKFAPVTAPKLRVLDIVIVNEQEVVVDTIKKTFAILSNGDRVCLTIKDDNVKAYGAEVYYRVKGEATLQAGDRLRDRKTGEIVVVKEAGEQIVCIGNGVRVFASLHPDLNNASKLSTFTLEKYDSEFTFFDYIAPAEAWEKQAPAVLLVAMDSAKPDSLTTYGREDAQRTAVYLINQFEQDVTSEYYEALRSGRYDVRVKADKQLMTLRAWLRQFGNFIGDIQPELGQMNDVQAACAQLVTRDMRHQYGTVTRTAFDYLVDTIDGQNAVEFIETNLKSERVNGENVYLYRGLMLKIYWASYSTGFGGSPCWKIVRTFTPKPEGVNAELWNRAQGRFDCEESIRKTKGAAVVTVAPVLVIEPNGGSDLPEEGRVTLTMEQKRAICDLVIGKVGGEQKAKQFGPAKKNKPFFLEVHIIEQGGFWDGHKTERTPVEAVVDAYGLIRSGRVFEEMVLNINERDPEDLIDQVGITYKEFMKAIAAVPLPNE